MRYVPNLIPKSAKVLPDYFKGSIQRGNNPSDPLNTVLWILSFSSLLVFYSYFPYILVSIFLGLLLTIILSGGNRFLERLLSFRLTKTIKVVTSTTLVVAILVAFNHDYAIEKSEELRVKIAKAKEKERSDKQELFEKSQRDSIAFYLNTSYKLETDGNLESAKAMLNQALDFTSDPRQIEVIRNTKTDIEIKQTIKLVKAGKTKAAIPELNRLLAVRPDHSELLLNRALCYKNNGKIAEAVKDYKMAMDQGSSEAEKFYNRLNPIRKRVTGYTTLCCDGSTSYARGRGACSHHGGVCNWNDPTYEEYRKYD